MILVSMNSPFGNVSSSHCGHIMCLLKTLIASWLAKPLKKFGNLPPTTLEFEEPSIAKPKIHSQKSLVKP